MKLLISTAAKAACFVILINAATKATAQQWQVGLGYGFANYGGELQTKRLTTQQSHAAYSASLAYLFNDQFSIRAEYAYANIGANDKFSTVASHVDRNLNFNARLYDYSATLHYNIYNLAQRRMTPYVFAGVAMFKASPYSYDETGTKYYLAGLNTEGQGLAQYPDRKPYSTKNFAIPFGGGLKMALSDAVQISFEMGFRKTFTDYIDDVSTTYADETLLQQAYGATAVKFTFRGNELKTQAYPTNGTRGNAATKDYYYFGMVKLNFNIGSKILQEKHDGLP